MSRGHGGTPGHEAREDEGMRIGPAVRLVGWMALLGAVIAGFSAVDAGPLAAPALREPSTWGTWARAREPVEIAFAVLRLVLLATAWYLLGVTVVGAVARLGRWGRLAAVADLLTVPAVRRLLQSALGVGLATAALTASPGSVDAPTTRPTQAAVSLAADVAEPDRATLTPLTDADGVGFLELLDEEPAQAPRDDVRTVRKGEHFWSIADDVLRAAWGRAPSDDEIVPYWRQLIAANRDRLPDPGNPDLLYPGDDLRLPQPPRRPADER